MIYSGSVALSRLPVPVFCAIHYISMIVQILLESLLFKKDLPINSQFSLIVTALAVVMVAATDTQFDQIGYKWMMLHCTFSAAYVLYGNSLRKSSLSDLDKTFCNAVTRFVIIVLFSFLQVCLFNRITNNCTLRVNNMRSNKIQCCCF
ncbi:PREDICTED: transmembrane protein 241-like isoform X1 [Acropora digitifera]|uniref:transmembrane protein 241-like isoform X1 n=1 Tax=Acropora digitifera TaxID=70779 RepID=UPI00077A54A0|nr:PREDICTED: transmembrane protein 241-like isoform X1 [Acropora digitifera]